MFKEVAGYATSYPYLKRPNTRYGSSLHTLNTKFKNILDVLIIP